MNDPFSCPVRNLCPATSPFAGFSSEAVDGEVYVGYNYGQGQPPLGSDWLEIGCVGVAVSSLSQNEANFLAQNANLACLTSGGNTGAGAWPLTVAGVDRFGNPAAIPESRPVFYNTTQNCQMTCEDGSPFVYTVPAGTFAGLTQALANEYAASYACQQVELHLICLTSLPGTLCFLNSVSLPIVATGRTVGPQNVWTLTGNPPPGLIVPQGTQSGDSITITGSPTALGVYSFSITCTTSKGDFMTKTYSMNVIQGITSIGNLPSATQRVGYFFQLTQSGLSNPTWSLVSGAMPAGYTVDPVGGFITSGSPANAETPGVYNFVIGVTDGVTLCTQAFTMTVNSWWNLAWKPPPYDISSGTFTAAFNPQGYSISVTEPGVVVNSNSPDFFPPTRVSANLHLVSAGSGPVNATVTITQGSAPPLTILDIGDFFNPGAYDFPFTVPLIVGPGNNVHVSIMVQAFGSPGTNQSLTATFQVL